MKYFLFLLFLPLFIFGDVLKVGVVGGGLAGLTAAYRLQQHGYDVVLYEAKNRVGGRVLSVYLNGEPSELGALNIYDGGEATNLLALIDELELDVVETKVALSHSFFDGHEIVSIQDRLKKYDFSKEKLLLVTKKSSNMDEILSAFFKEDPILYKVFYVRLAAYEGGTPEKLSTRYIETLYHMLSGGLSAAHQGNSENHFIEVASVKGGNSLLPIGIAKELKHLRLNKALKKLKKVNDQYELIFKDGSKDYVDILVLAIPSTVYQDIEFENIIPQDRLEKIKAIQYGTNAKILIPIKNQQERVGLLNDRLVGFFNQDLTTFIFYYTGNASHFSKGTISNTYLKDYPILKAGLKNPNISLNVIYSEDKAFSSYNQPVGYSWPNDPYTKGSYSYIGVGQDKWLTATSEVKGEVVRTLFTPIDDSLYFAGEHTSTLFDVSATMEAAVESGEKAFRMIVK